jgi:uncharacterized protein YbaP (TraB family)
MHVHSKPILGSMLSLFTGLLLAVIAPLLLPVLAAGTPRPKIERPPFFSITSPEGKVSYALGTVHYAIGVDEMPDKVMTAFNSSEYHFAELQGFFEPQDVSDKLLASLADPEKFNKHWPEYVTKKLVNKGEKLTSEQKKRGRVFGLPEHALNNFYSGMSCDFLFFADIFYGQEPFHRLDNELGRLSKKLKKQTLALEDEKARLKASLYAELMTGEIDEVRECTIGEILNSDAFTSGVKLSLIQFGAMKSIVAPYRQSLREINFKKFDVKAPRNFSLEYRNRAWVVKTLPYLINGGVFIFAGASHFEGRNNFLYYLQGRGFKIKAL